jgi:hypothetical protein
MRPLQVHVRADEVERVLEAAEKHGATRPVTVPADPLRAHGQRTQERWSLVLLHLPNENVGAFVEDVRQDLDDPQFILLPVGALPLETPLSELHPQVRDVSRLSTLELVVASLQSIGSWRGMLMFSALAGIIGAYGLIFDIGYVLVAAMLVNPMGAPALVSVIGLTIGDLRMFGRGALRFFVSLVVQAAAALTLGFAYGLSVSTAMMEQVTSLSAWAVLIAVAAGIAGAQAQASSDRDSLVSGTATGFMVAAALAPPAAVLGLAVPLGRWDYFGLMAFLLGLQYLGIVAGGWVGLTVLGVRPSGRAWVTVTPACAPCSSPASSWPPSGSCSGRRASNRASRSRTLRASAWRSRAMPRPTGATCCSSARVPPSRAARSVRTTARQC